MSKRKFSFVTVEGNECIRDFKMSTTVVTQGLYKAIMGKNPVVEEVEHGFQLYGANWQSLLGVDKPVVCVSWYEALAFCNALSKKQGLPPCYDHDMRWVADVGGYRLPTEAEWEWAAKGGKLSHGYTYSGSNDFRDVAVCSENYAEMMNVATLKPNELGLYDMSGLVGEWCWDEWCWDDGSPTSDRVFRGSWYNMDVSWCEVSKRFNSDPDAQSGCIGFRVVRNAN